MNRLLLEVQRDLGYEPMAVRLRAYDGDRTVLDSVNARLVWEPRRVVPSYAVPEDDLLAAVRPATAPPPPAPDAHVEIAPGIRILPPGQFRVHSSPGEELAVEVGGGWQDGAAFRLADPDLPGVVVLDFTAFDRWLEEEEPVVGHPRDPFKRIDVKRSSRHVRVERDGVLLADSRSPSVLLETSLPPRWYLPAADVRFDVLESSSSRTVCAYKGFADYWALNTEDLGAIDICWTYRDPLTDALAVKDMVCFYSEQVDVIVDGERRARPVTPFSAPVPRGTGHLL